MRFEPHPYQAYAVEHILNNPAAGLFLDMGLGKTVVTLTAINELRFNRFAVGRVLIIAPKTVAEATWQKEAQKWDHLRGLRLVTVLGTAKQRVRALDTPGDVWIINRENVAWLVDLYRHDWPFDMVVLDESSSFKSSRAIRFKKLRLVRGRISRIVELTGTPSPKGLEDLWAQVYLLDEGKRLGRTLTSFREAFFTEDRGYPGQTFRTYTPQPFAEERIHAALSDICVSMKADDYLSLPECIVDDIPVVLSPTARKAYQTFERDYLLSVDEDDITAGSAAVLTGKLLQLCSGAIYDEDHAVHRLHDAKVAALVETIEQVHDHVLVFYLFRHEIDRILAALEQYDSSLRVRVYKGAEDEADWNAGKIDVLLAHPASCGYGLNLQQGGHHAVWYGLTWALEQYQQANKRLHRQGQDMPVIIHRLIVQDSVDEDVAASLEGKAGTQDALMQALKARIRAVKERRTA